MGRSQKDIKPMYGIIKEMYESGENVKNIVEILGICNDSVYKALSVMGIKHRLREKKKEEKKLNNADKSTSIPEKVVIYGQWKVKEGIRYRKKSVFTDIAPLIMPR